MWRPFRCAFRIVATLFCFVLVPAWAQQPAADAGAKAIGSETPWPRTVRSAETTLTMYQPQIDSWDGYTLRARLAVQSRLASGKSFYGVIGVDARTLTDKGRRVVTVDRVEIARADFPAASPEQTQRWSRALADDLQRQSRTIALDRLEATLAVEAAARDDARQALRNSPPGIVFSSAPAVLVYIDGRPVYVPFDDTGFERIINTRPLLLRGADGTHYLKIFDGWLQAPALTGPWTVAQPSDALAAAYAKAGTLRVVDPLSGQVAPDRPAPRLAQTVPGVLVATTPTELIVTDGPPDYVPIANTQLLYVANTTGHVFKDIGDNQTYVLIAGRWFRAPAETGPWEFVAANRLPADFRNIPDDSAKENVKASVAETVQAREAVIAARIPQTAAVKIAGTTMSTPQFDGEPAFVSIEGTSLSYVYNTPLPLIRVAKDSFYAVENGVWFTATAVRGPWRVAVEVPAEIYAIPPTSPLHYVTYVRIFAVTDDVVYVGYTAGYQGTEIDPATDVVVYGTGYLYDPWIGSVWYGPPCTYGFGSALAYTPWTGWTIAYGFGWAWGDSTVAIGWGWGAYPWWGPWGWGWAWGPPVYPWYPAWGVAYGAHGGAAAWGPGGWAGYSGNIYQNWGDRASVSRVAGGYDAWTGNRWASRVGMSYNSRTGIAAAGQRGAVENIYSGDFAAGGRGVASGPGGRVVAGERGVVGNVGTGTAVAGSRGVVYDRNTGEATGYGRIKGADGSIGRYGNDIYAGKDGNIYRNTNGSWEQRTANGWQPVAGGAQGAAARGDQLRQLNRESSARNVGAQRTQHLRSSSMGMSRSFRGGGGGRRR